MVVTIGGNDNAQPSVFVSKTVTFTGAAGLGAAGAVPWFTTTGQVRIKSISGRILTSVTGTAGDTLALGVTGSTALFIGATALAALVSTTPVWVDATPVATGKAIPAALKEIAIAANIIGTVAGTALTAGAIALDVEYVPLTPGASLS